jgi:hypothetical protein
MVIDPTVKGITEFVRLRIDVKWHIERTGRLCIIVFELAIIGLCGSYIA